MGRSPEAAAQLREPVAGGSMGVGVMTTDDCQQTYEELLGKGVTFLSEPAERPYELVANQVSWSHGPTPVGGRSVT